MLENARLSVFNFFFVCLSWQMQSANEEKKNRKEYVQIQKFVCKQFIMAKVKTRPKTKKKMMRR